MSPAGAVVTAYDGLDSAQRQAVDAIVSAAEAVDEVAPLDDQVRLDVEFGGPLGTRHLIATMLPDDGAIGYAHLSPVSAAHAVSAHAVVDPAYRRLGVGRALISGLAEESDGAELKIWAHGDVPAARGLAGLLRFHRVRELRQLRATLDRGYEPSPPAGVTVRQFQPGRDEDNLIAVNAVAFADHPEQGRLTRADLEQRMRQAWFDAGGVFLAERDSDLLGFHWTKVHETGASDGGPIGEVYVLGVRPDAQGLGLGKVLTLTGMQHLRKVRKLDEIMLYVESDNEPALAMYERLGFTTAQVDVMYARA